MLKGSLARGASALAIDAVVLREDDSAEPIKITDLSFNDCQILCATTLAIGERLRLHLEGQGWIEAEVTWSAQKHAGLVFLATPKV